MSSNAGGSGLADLTNSPAADKSPIWSPQGFQDTTEEDYEH